MANVSVTKSINVAASAAWANLSSFKNIEDISPIASSVTHGEGQGMTRVCTMPDGAAINETLDLVDNEKMHMQYSIQTGPFPFTNYVSDVVIKSTGDDSCEITWSSSFDVDDVAKEEMVNLLTGFYNVIIESLEKVIKGVAA